jgi:putative endonuclease
MSKRRQELGHWGETQAIRHLEARGCELVARNWRCTAGEADVIVQEGDCLAFVEVRTRRGRAYGSPEESITPKKLARMAAVAESYVYEHGWEGNWRLDVVAVRVRAGQDPGAGPEPAIEWYRNVSM